jgi:hypothetical protein
MPDTVQVPSRSPGFGEVLALAIRNGLAEVHTTMPGVVTKWDELTQLADVKPLVMQQVLEEDGSTSSVPYPVLRNVPMIFPGANGFRLTLPVVPGDEVELTFAECSLEVWKANGGTVDPKDARRFHISDATCTPGLHSKQAPWTGVSKTAATLGKDGGPQAVFRAGGIELGGDDANAATEPLILGQLRKTAEDIHLDGTSNALSAAQSAVAAAAAAATTLGAACGQGPLADLSPGFAALGAALVLAQAQLGLASASFTTFKAAIPPTLSQLVKVK